MICSCVRRFATYVRSGPRWPPCPSSAWHAWHPFALKSCAPCATWPVVVPTISAERGGRRSWATRARARQAARACRSSAPPAGDADRPGPALRAALAAVRDEGEESRARPTEQRRREDDDQVSSSCGSSASTAKIPEEIPVGPRIGLRMRRVGRRVQLRRADDRSPAATMTPSDDHAEDHVAPGGVGPEGHALALEELAGTGSR